MADERKTVSTEENAPAVESATTKFQRPERYYRPRIALTERDEDFLLSAEMPGAGADNVDVHYEDGTLHLVGRVTRRRPAGAKSLIEEYGVGDFYHALRVGEAVDTQGIEAEYNAGVLQLRLPKAEQHRPRRIPVSVN